MMPGPSPFVATSWSCTATQPDWEKVAEHIDAFVRDAALATVA